MPTPDPDELTAGLIHELRHPVMSIKLGLQLLERAAGVQVAHTPEWPLVLQQLTRLEQLLSNWQQFLDPRLSRHAPFAVGPMIDDALAACGQRLRPLGDRFSPPPPDPELWAFGSPNGVVHALTNVLHNALDALAEAGGTGRLALRVFARPGRIELRVSDEGPGIPLDQVERIFEARFTTKGEQGGSGLGLALARRLIEAMGGTIDVVPSNDADRLAWARTELRVSIAAAATDQGVQPAAAAVRPKVLLIEDDAVICAMLKRSLIAQGYEALTAATAEEALELFARSTFDAVVTDKNLPTESGTHLAQVVRAHSADVALVMMTGYASRDSAMEMKRLGADAYLTKPFELEEFVATVATAISTRAARVRLRSSVREGRVLARPSRVAVVEQEPKDSARLVGLLEGLSLVPEVRSEALEVLEGAATLDALVISSACLTDEVKRRLQLLHTHRPEFPVVLVSSTDGMVDWIDLILLNAHQVQRRWTDAQIAQTLETAFDLEEPLP